MKKRHIWVLLALVTLAISAGTAHAQIEWNLGVKGGLNLVNLKGDDVEEVKMNTAFLAGAAVMAQINENFGVGLDILYARKGTKSELADVTIDLDYVEVPVLAVGMYPAHEKATLMGYIGPGVSFLMAAKDFDGEDVKDEVKGVDFGVVFGAGAIINAGSVKVTIEGRYNLGLMSIDKAEGDEEEADVKNSAISVMAGLMFPLGGGE